MVSKKDLIRAAIIILGFFAILLLLSLDVKIMQFSVEKLILRLKILGLVTMTFCFAGISMLALYIAWTIEIHRQMQNIVLFLDNQMELIVRLRAMLEERNP
ncbi:uncharacterized protein LOC119687979 [Teleopsis dalmanni]|uniref:uncharacterized protein LOC119687979 n=1 Tax=Teleopsis dalmanni TaxID=139649 RepID=UPI0018CDCFE1|nr:uncharacterized protein LOC119687979 [Teleopsis dalmanni]